MAIIAEPAIAQPIEIVGTWKFSTYVRTNPITGKNTNIFGDHPRGWLIYTAEGHMMVIVIPESRKTIRERRGTNRTSQADGLRVPDRVRAPLDQPIRTHSGFLTDDEVVGRRPK
jgi:Lipocalin-like domain